MHCRDEAFSTQIIRVVAESDIPKWREMDASNHVLLDDVSGSKVVSRLEFHIVLFAVRPMDDSIPGRSDELARLADSMHYAI